MSIQATGVTDASERQSQASRIGARGLFHAIGIWTLPSSTRQWRFSRCEREAITGGRTLGVHLSGWALGPEAKHLIEASSFEALFAQQKRDCDHALLVSHKLSSGLAELMARRQQGVSGMIPQRLQLAASHKAPKC